jgi:putative Ca2+/H+ antiporter (TMEM165/GDT1 family)
MDWKLAVTTFATIFMAEMGDKTQLAIITLSASSKKPLSIFVGGALALTSVTLIGVLAGEAVAKVVPESVLTRTAAVLFVAIGIWTWFKA